MSSFAHRPHGPKTIAIIGGGAAGYFSALTVAELNPKARIEIFEKGNQILSKVKISGGGRCNVTHHCFDPQDLAARYPRGSRELRGAFYHWQPEDTIRWFAERGVKLKTEEDGRMFPVTNSSQTIIDCFIQSATRAGIRLNKQKALKRLKVEKDGRFSLEWADESISSADAVCIAVGSLKASPLLNALTKLGHSIQPLAPSLFAFNVSDKRLSGLSGISVPSARVEVHPGGRKNQAQVGPLLITHRGLSGPAILRLSAWEARVLQERNYHFQVEINWMGDVTKNTIQEAFNRLRKNSGKGTVFRHALEPIPRRLWERLATLSGIDPETRWAQLPKESEERLLQELAAGVYSVEGKTTNKDEFVTCGGVSLKEIDFRRMESRLVPNLHFAGECLDLDGITGGFNFQAAWTTGRIAGEAMAEGYSS